MSDVCRSLHELMRGRTVHRFPFREESIPKNGIYVLFEQGELGHGGERIVRVGTHTGDGQLRSRLKQHFIQENKDRSIFRKNIGRALLNRADDPFLEQWNLDLTSRRNRERHAAGVDFDKQAAVETEVSARIQRSFHFVVLDVAEKERRLELERKMIGTVSLCEDCGPSADWLGLASPKPKIRDSGLWQEQELWKESFGVEDLDDALWNGGVNVGGRKISRRQDAQGRARAGSQLHTQVYVNRRQPELSEAVAEALGGDVDPDIIEWRAPLEWRGYEEPMDRGFLEAIGLEKHREALRGFWPSSGPRWDALAVLASDGGPGVLLVEGKSYPAEMESALSATAESSIRLIRESLAWAKGVLGADRTADWTQPYYQFANRLAHVCFLREELDVRAWLVNLCFVNDKRRPTSVADWKPALHQVRRRLGFGSQPIPHTVDVFLPARERSELTGAGADPASEPPTIPVINVDADPENADWLKFGDEKQ